MTVVTAEIVIDAPADAVWQVVAHRFDRIGEWATAIPASTSPAPAPPAAAPGATGVAAGGAPVVGRVCHTGIFLVPTVTETVVGHDEAARSLTYEASDGVPAFVTTARNRWQVTAVSDTQCRAAFHAQLDVRGPLGALARWWLLARVGRSGGHLLADLKHYVEHGVPAPRKQRQLEDAAARTGDPVAAVGVWPTTRRLRSGLRANAAFSLGSGLILMLGGWWFAGPWGVRPAAVLPLIGVAVAGFGVVVARVAVMTAPSLLRWSVGVTVADLAWIVASTVLLAVQPLTAAGATAGAAVAAAVAGLAGWQLAGLAAARPDDPLADVEVAQAVRTLDAPPSAVWPLLADHELYGRLAPNLSTVEVISAPGQPLRRRCTDTAGRGWEETYTLWEDGRRFAVHVDTRDYPYPLPLMRGLWQVDPDPGGSRVTMRFAFRAAPTIRGGLFAMRLRVLFPLALSRIFAGWRRTLRTTPASPPSRPRTGAAGGDPHRRADGAAR